MCAKLKEALVSIIIPIFNEEKNLMEIYRSTNEVLASTGKNYEIIFIDDGSEDNTAATMKDIQNKNERVKLIKFERNCRQLRAILAGFKAARGNVIITMDGDLQNNPSDIPKFLAKIDKGFDFVNGWRYNRKDKIIRKLISIFANWLIGMKTGVKLRDYGCAFTAVKKEIIDRLMDYGDNARFIKPLTVILANSITEIKIEHYPRKRDKSKYGFVMIIKSGLDFVFNFNVDLYH